MIVPRSQPTAEFSQTLVLAFHAALIFCFFFGMEFALRYAVADMFWLIDMDYAWAYAVIALGLALIDSRKVLITVLATVALLQIIWFGTYGYYGNVLGPEIIMLGFSQLYEIGIVLKQEIPTFILPVLLAVCLNMLLFFLVRRMRRGWQSNRTYLGIFLVSIPFIVVSTRAAVHALPFVLNPTPYMPSQFGTVQAVTLAVRRWISPRSVSNRNAPKLIIGDKIGGERPAPVNVVVIMGESIAPLQMSLFGGDPATMPRMAKRLAGSGRLSYEARLGFSAGTSTLGSIPAFIRMAYNPAEAGKQTTSLFQIAKESGFSTGYYSAQRITPLQISGGLNQLDRVQTVENWEAEFAARQDGILLDQMTGFPIGSNKQFFFLNQRANHTPYDCTRKAEPIDVEATSAATDLAQQDDRVVRYRSGLRCYDKSLDELLAYFEQLPGETYVFITSDHNELMGENGKWGHGNLDIQTALVPMILATNRPDSDIFKAFAGYNMPSAFQVVQLVAKALGRDIHLELFDDRFFVNGVIPFAAEGYIEARRTASPDRLMVKVITAATSDSDSDSQEIELLGLEKGLAFLQAAAQARNKTAEMSGSSGKETQSTSKAAADRTGTRQKLDR